MAGRKVRVHGREGSEEAAIHTHDCVHCETTTLCTEEEGHNPAECEYPPEYTCRECEERIFQGKFRFGGQREGCDPKCDWNDKTNQFKHHEKCKHHWKNVYRKVAQTAAKEKPAT